MMFVDMRAVEVLGAAICDPSIPRRSRTDVLLGPGMSLFRDEDIEYLYRASILLVSNESELLGGELRAAIHRSTGHCITTAAKLLGIDPEKANIDLENYELSPKGLKSIWSKLISKYQVNSSTSQELKDALSKTQQEMENVR